jgi:hypothetical protein
MASVVDVDMTLQTNIYYEPEKSFSAQEASS